jgi:hypothetical protein
MSSLIIRKMRFRRRAIPGYRSVREPTAGDLKHPVALYRSARTPNENSGFTQVLSCYRNKCFAAFDPAPERMMEGENADPTATHVFTVRWDGKMLVELRDYVQLGNRFYKVLFTKQIGKMNDFLAIYTIEHFEEGTNDAIQIAPTTIEPTQDNSSLNNSGWNLPAA